MAELRPKQWTTYAAANGWYATGVMLHDAMLAVGYDPTRDTWAVNEVGTPSDSPVNTDVFAGTDGARQNFRDFVRGLYTGSSGPPMAGLVFTADPPQMTTDIWQYEQGLASWYSDAPFWQDMQQYVRFWAQETYADAPLVGRGRSRPHPARLLPERLLPARQASWRPRTVTHRRPPAPSSRARTRRSATRPTGIRRRRTGGSASASPTSRWTTCRTSSRREKLRAADVDAGAVRVRDLGEELERDVERSHLRTHRKLDPRLAGRPAGCLRRRGRVV